MSNPANYKPCHICREHHEPGRTLSYDGQGVNSCGAFRDRIAKVGPSYSHIGDLLASAPELFSLLNDLVEGGDSDPEGSCIHCGDMRVTQYHDDRCQNPKCPANIARELIKKLKGNNL